MHLERLQSSGENGRCVLGVLGFLIAAPLHSNAQTPAPATAQSSAPSQASNEVSSVTVAGSARVKSSVDRRSYDVKSDLQYQSGSIADVLGGVPSVSVDTDGAVKLRGASGVTILIDGEPAPQVNGANQASALQQLRASQFSRVEVMTNPSAAFGPEGGAGVLNLITRPARKGQSTTGLNASLASRGSYGIGATQSITDGPLSFNAAVGNRRKDALVSQRTVRRFYSAGDAGADEDTLTSQGQRRNDQTDATANLGWQLSAKDKATFDVGYFGVRAQNQSDVDYDASGRMVGAAESFQSEIDNRWTADLVWGSATLRHALPGPDHYLLARFRFSRQTEDDIQKQRLDYVRAPANSAARNMLRSLDQTTLTFKAEYKNALARGGELVAGHDLERLEAITGYVEIGPGAALRNGPFSYRRTTGAIYATYKRTFGKLEVQPGARFENSEWVSRQATGELRKRDTAFYPTAHLRYPLNEDWNLGGSYTERVDRLRPADHDEFAKFSSPLYFTSGRRDLRPGKTRAYEFEIERNKGGRYFLATAFYRQKSNRIEALSVLRPDGTILEIKSNVGDFRTGGIELVTSGAIGPSLSYKLTGQYGWSQTAPSPALALRRQRSATPSAQANLNWKITGSDFVQLSAIQLGNDLGQQRRRQAFRFVNAGYRRKIEEGLFATLTVSDLFDSAPSRETVQGQDFDSQLERRFDGRRVTLSISYSFGRNSGRVDDRFDYGSVGN